jgi:GH25 family lysozyme M1 (1,4-beta-N-acetylmuramidase)
MRAWRVLTLAAIGAAGSWLAPPIARASVEGIDVSKWQGTIDWPSVAGAGIKFAFIRVSDGANYLDPQFDRNWREAKNAGILRGPYQFFRPTQDGTRQANVLLAKVPHLAPGDLPPVLDVEVTDGATDWRIVNEIGNWVSRVRAAIGRDPIVYTSPGFWGGLSGARSYGTDLWVAHWFVSHPTLPRSWSGWKFWQYSDRGHVAGIGGVVDLDRWNGSLADLRAYAGISPTPDYAARLVSVSAPASLYAGEQGTVSVEYDNIGAKPWNGSTRLGTTEPRDHASALFVPGDWLGANRPTAVDAATAPGGRGRFTFKIRAPQSSQQTTVTESFRLVQESVTWFPASPDTRVSISVQVRPIEWAGEVVASSFPTTLDEGQTATCFVEYENRGVRAWDAATHLGTTDPQDHPSPLYTAGSWLGPNRAAAAPGRVAPGARARFTFTITAPAVASGTQTFTEKLRLVQENVAWFHRNPDSLVTFSVRVRHVPKPGAIDVVSDPPGASVYVSGNPEYAGRYVGRSGPRGGAPLAIAGLAPLRRYHVRVEIPGLAPREVAVTVPDGGRVRVDEALGWRPRETFCGPAPVAAAGRALLARGGYAAPFVIDWDEDGNLDLVVGNGDGTIDVYPGAAARDLALGAPQPARLAGGAARVAARAAPFVVDWDDDDRKDLLVGAADGKVYLFVNAGRDEDPVFAAPVAIEAAGAPFVAPGGNAAPWVVDWDGDGKKDLLVGGGDGSVTLLANTGTDALPLFAAAETVALPGGRALGVAADAAPLAADWSRDGFVDLALGSNAGDLVLLAAQGPPGGATFPAAPPSTLAFYANGAGRPALVLSGRVALADLRGAGLRDLVMGDASGAVTIARGAHLAADVDDSKEVDGRDLFLVLRAYGAKRGDPGYAPWLDIDGDGAISGGDVAAVEAGFGGTY